MERRVRPRQNRQESNLYVYGNTVRKLEAVPERQPERREQQEQRNYRAEKNAVRKNREKAKQMNRPYVIFLTMASVVSFLVCFHYIELRSQMTAQIKNIAALESALSDLKIENDAELSRVNNSIDLEEIKKIAMEELGMVYANKDQVILYQDKEAEYFRQYESVTGE